MWKYLLCLLLLITTKTYAVTECTEVIINYFVGTSEVNESVSHLQVNFESGGSASVISTSAAYEGMLSSVITSVVAGKTVKLRYVEDEAVCKKYHDDWVGIWVYKQQPVN